MLEQTRERLQAARRRANADNGERPTIAMRNDIGVKLGFFFVELPFFFSSSLGRTLRRPLFHRGSDRRLGRPCANSLASFSPHLRMTLGAQPTPGMRQYLQSTSRPINESYLQDGTVEVRIARESIGGFGLE